MRSIDPILINGTIIRFDKAPPINNNGNSEVEPHGQARGTILTPLWSDIFRLGSTGRPKLKHSSTAKAVSARKSPLRHAGVVFCCRGK